MLLGVGVGVVAEEQAQATLVSVQVALGRIEGVLSTVVTEHSRRIEDNSKEISKVRVDMDGAVKALDLKVEAGKESHNKIIREIDGRIAATAATTVQNKEDVKSIQEDKAGNWTKTASLTGIGIAAASFIWPIIHR